MTPVNLAQSIPLKVRQVIYSLLATALAVEVALDAFDYGLVDAKPQGAIVAVLGALGFAMARANTPTPVDEV